ncbi:hypothetical protein KFK09_029017 [Dendrobium nobile]|uniref:Uncharacterized protein n=1 Tax=Dendrobium nobile TaxID=94219 RepID=A0A8T3A395_DENNO|nr:hypothetical protein KFK09_029017 [Dendrobium nobile]
MYHYAYNYHHIPIPSSTARCTARYRSVNPTINMEEEETNLRHRKSRYAELEISQNWKKKKRRLEKMKHIQANDD